MSTFEFPPELELKILQIAASDSRRTALALVRVCRRIQTWIDPILYATIVLVDKESSRCLLQTMEAKGEAFIGKHVKNVWIQSLQTYDEVSVRMENRLCMCRILTKCKAVEKVLVRREGFHGRAVDISDIWESLLRSGSHPTHLATYSNILQELEMLKDTPDNDITTSSVSSLFANITHLETMIVPKDWAIYLGGFSATVPSLTHLAMLWSGKLWNAETDPAALADFVGQHPGIKVILLLARNAHTDLDVLRSNAFDLGSLRVVLEYDYSQHGGMLYSQPIHYSSSGLSGGSTDSLQSFGPYSVSVDLRRYDQAMKDMHTHSVRWDWAEGKVQQQLETGKHDFSEIIEKFEADLYDEWEDDNRLCSGDFEGIEDSD